ncbi:MAG: divergent polysaccharide deacetylase family protein [Haemophilus parainfluenzae]|nr:divergent polysaccharide deacetylase family protein [Haemophilus parainfluenzae]
MAAFFQSAVRNTIIFSTALFSAFTFAQGKLAIVIDDIGYHPKEDAEVLAMPKEVSVAIIPAAPYAKIRNQEAKAQNHDILIHMPMQPVSNIKIEEGGLTLGLSEAQVNERVKKAKAIVRTIGKSVAGKIAKEQGVRVLDRHVFLDDSDNLADVQRQFQSAIQYARKHGTAIAIGHPRPNTVAVLKSGIKNLPDDIQLVGMGSLWRNEKILPPKPFILIFNDIPAPTSVAPFEPIPLLRGVPR